MDLDFQDGIQLIAKARRQNKEDRQFELYASAYPHMTEENFMQFDEFYNPDAIEDDRNAEDILSEVKASLDKNKGEWVPSERGGT